MHTISITIFRIFGDDKSENTPDDNEVKLQLHNNRKQALHEVFDNQHELEVKSWGSTDDTHSHEFVSIAIIIGANAFANYAIIPAAKFIFEKVTGKAIDTAVEKSVSWILSKFKKKQEEKKIGRFEIRLPNGVVLFADNPQQGSKIRFHIDGILHEVEF